MNTALANQHSTENALVQLAKYTTVVADTGDLKAIKQFKPLDATTNPSLITAAATLPENLLLIEQAHQQAVSEGYQQDALIERIIDILTVKLGIEILQVIDGRVSTEVDASLSYNTAETIDKAHELLALYEQAGVDKNRVLIKIASTWQGIQAAKQLEAQGIHCNLTLLFGLHQAAACAEANVTLISPFVGRILDWYKKAEQKDSYPIELDPGVLSVKKIYEYYKQHGYNTQIMGASFRSTAQIIALAGSDLLTIAPALLEQLSQSNELVQPHLSTEKALQAPAIDKLDLDEAKFQALLEHDLMAFQLLQGGVDGFIKAREQLAQQLRQTFSIGEIQG
jgi:transaldolase